MLKKNSLLTGVAVIVSLLTLAQENYNHNKFKQLKEELPTPNVYRNAAGAPGHEYYQQKADYDMKIRIDDENQKLYGIEEITYYNNSPDPLEYLWVQLDQNVREQNSLTDKVTTMSMEQFYNVGAVLRFLNDFDGGFKIEHVKDSRGNSEDYFINATMMRIDLDEPLQPGDSYSFEIKWWYNINDRSKIGGRSGFEYFEEEDNYLYTIAQFFPRMAVYNDVEGWQNKQFLGRGEFALVFGDYEVEITVPEDHIVAATGVLQNSSSVLTSEQRSRWQKAQTADMPVMIVSEEEAIENEKEKAEGTKTWIFEAKNVRDFAFATSRKFIWDAMAVKQPSGKKVMAMSYYPKEGNPLWGNYSTKAVAQTLETYSSHTFDYPYPVAISVHTDRIGMEYPMICFNGGRPLPDGTYSERTKYGMISVIIHEVGHNYFPMIVNSDERQWTWMDEGLNTFLQYLTEQQWERGYPSRRGPAYKIVDYMKGDKEFISPIMTNSESIWQFGNNAYGKPATALNILRETVMGRELFDYAFKTYAQRWMFKHPTPADFFRTMEDASGVDLDWFWRAWFFTTDHVDIAMNDVQWFQLNTQDPNIEAEWQKEQDQNKTEFIGDTRNKKLIKKTRSEKDPSINDFYNNEDPYEVDVLQQEQYDQFIKTLTEEEKALLSSGKNFYEIQFSNEGGVPMPLILRFTFEDGSTEVERIPTEVWRRSDQIKKVFVFDKTLTGIELDPFLETADTDTGNNHWPRKVTPSRFDLFMDKSGGENPMQRAKRIEERED